MFQDIRTNNEIEICLTGWKAEIQVRFEIADTLGYHSRPQAWRVNRCNRETAFGKPPAEVAFSTSGVQQAAPVSMFR
jgi:hypothetical protein